MPDELKTLADIAEDAQNANLGTERGAFALQESLVRFGPGRSIVVDRKGKLIAGEKTKRTAERLGLPIQVVRTQGDKLVVVQREDLDLEEDGGLARALSIADNRAAELNLAWDAQAIAEQVEAGLDLSAFFYDRELEQLIGEARLAELQGEGEEEADYAPLCQAAGVELLLHPSDVAGIGPLRQWILDNVADEVVFMVDDDVSELGVVAGRGTRHAQIRDPQAVAQVIANAAECAQVLGTPIFGFSQNGADVRKFRPQDPFVLATWVGGAIGIIGRELRYDTGGNAHQRSGERNAHELAYLKNKWGKWLEIRQAKETTLLRITRVQRRQNVRLQE